MDIRGYIEEILKDKLKKIPFVEIEVPKIKEHGDISTPVAMVLAKELKRSPIEIANEIKEKLSSIGIFEKVDIAGAGFINLFFKKEYLFKELKSLLNAPEKYLRKNIGKGEKIQIEFVSANPTGPLHLGHGRGAAVGAALSNLLKRAGYEVEREFYINDAGRQVNLLGKSIFAKYHELFGSDYPFPEDGYRGDYIKKIAQQIKDQVKDHYLKNSFVEVADFFINFGIEKMLSWIKEDLQYFGVFFDRWQSEKALYKNKIVHKCYEELKKNGYLYEKDKAIWFKAKKFGDNKDRVIIKSDRTPTYFASDIAYHWYKFHRGFNQIVNIWGADHHGYIPRIKAVIKALGQPEDRLKILLVQMVNLLRGGKVVQMSKRTGEFITLREVIEEVGADITKFIFLTRRCDSHLDFDIEIAKKQSSENPVYYVQYAHARINSIFNNIKKPLENIINNNVNLSLLKEKEEIELIKKILFYPIMFEGAVRQKEPHRVTFYLQELASCFHSFYTKHRVLVDNLDLQKARLSLCKATFIVLKEGLSIIGVEAPERM